MENSTFEVLCEASQLSFADTEKENFMERLSSIIEFTEIIKNIDADSSSIEPQNSVSLGDLREDTALPSFPAEKLLANTEPLFDCYVIPKIME
ncbi:MAG: aspartyl/glutamyl-tRNA amidotransferase subunit C [Oscillospiraceae bacterium]|nr:aspartyl/glutamyl-tRNA amidotransferase subunit C [Oscillospiraceae bacterium]